MASQPKTPVKVVDLPLNGTLPTCSPEAGILDLVCISKGIHYLILS